jgi:hypothetical protein
MADDRRKKTRHNASEYLPVYDVQTGELAGELANASSDGVMLLSNQPFKSASVYHFKLKLSEPIMGHDVIEFEAECRWCRKNVTLGRWESGYRISLAEGNGYLMQFVCFGFDLCGWGDNNIQDVKTVDMQNRRKATRFELAPPLPVFEFDSYHQLGTLTDISLEGVRIISSVEFVKGSPFKCRVQLPKQIFQTEYLTLNLKCVRLRKDNVRGVYDTGHLLQAVDKTSSAILMHLMIHYAEKLHSTKKILIVR